MSDFPFLKFYPSDWRAGSVGRCSLAARGLAIELVGFIHEAGDRGRLLIDGGKPSAEKIAQAVRAPIAEVEPLLAELIRAGAFKRWRGYLISPRAKRDAEKLARQVENGRKGAARRYGGGPKSPGGTDGSPNTPKGAPSGEPSPQKPETRDQTIKKGGRGCAAPPADLSDEWRPGAEVWAQALEITGLTAEELGPVTQRFLGYWLMNREGELRDWDATWLLQAQREAPMIRRARRDEGAAQTATRRQRRKRAAGDRSAWDRWESGE